MTYRKAVRQLNSRQMFGIKLGLTNIKKLLKCLGNPERSFPCIHIAGTNGKGSTSAILAAIFSAQGLRTGLYTSPHIVSVRERFRINDEQITPSEFAALFEQIVPHLTDIPCTYFECTTALAFLYFRSLSVDTAVIEAGLGGRFDATNVVTPGCSVITTIGYDHQAYLGDSLKQITREKCGIIKNGIPVVSGVEQEECRRIVASIAAKGNAPLHEIQKVAKISNQRFSITGTIFDACMASPSGKDLRLQELFLSLPGLFQVSNAQTALAAYSVMRHSHFPDDEMYYQSSEKSCGNAHAIRSGLASVVWQERFTVYRKKPVIIIDVAHNEAGFKALSDNIRKLFPQKKVLLIVSMKEDKDWEKAIIQILPLCREGIGVPLCGFKSHSVRPRDLRPVFNRAIIPYRYFRSVRKGVLYAVETAGDDIILCAGSHYSVNAVKKAINSLD